LTIQFVKIITSNLLVSFIHKCEQNIVKLPMPHMSKFSRIHEKGTNFREVLAKPISMVYDMSVRQSAVRIIMLIVHINILIALTS